MCSSSIPGVMSDSIWLFVLHTICVMYVQVTEGRVWTVGQDMSMDSASIGGIQSQLADGDEVHVYAPGVYDECLTAPIHISLTIRGIGQSHIPINGTCEQEETDPLLVTNHAPFLHFVGGQGEQHVNIDNIEFTNGYILAANTHLHITNATFLHSTVRFMGGNETVSYDKGEFNFRGDGDNWYTPMEHNVCRYGTLSLSDTHWVKVCADNPTSLTETSLLKWNIIMKCSVVQANLQGNYFGNRRVHILSSRQLVFNASSLTFHGQDDAEKRVGGISLLLPKLQRWTNIMIDNCTFSNLIPENVFFGWLFSRFVMTAPIAIYALKIDAHDYRKHDNDHIYISDCRFINNQRAIILQKIYIAVNIHSSTFHGNKVVIQGGAITSSAQVLHIQDCLFINNEAGATLTYELKSGELLFYGVNHYPHVQFFTTEAKVHYIYTNFNNDSYEQMFAKAGGGGALYVEDGSVYIVNSTFEGNIAYDSGGAIYLSNSARATISDSYFTNSLDIDSTLEGYLIFSVGESLILDDVTLEVNLVPENGVDSSAVFYFGRRGKCKMKNVKMICPTDFSIAPYNSSSEATSGATRGNDLFHVFDTVYFACEKCEDTYNLKGGWLQMSPPSQESTEGGIDSSQEGGIGKSLEGGIGKSQVHVYTGNCLPCPYGGDCTLSARAKPNYWGAIQHNTLSFYRCPKTYCCLNNSCPSYDFCSGNRTGKLCGMCSSGHTQALFSNKCVAGEQCDDYYILGLAGILGVAYTAFLMFQKDITNWLMSSPVKRHKKAKPLTGSTSVLSAAPVKAPIAGDIGQELVGVCHTGPHINNSFVASEEDLKTATSESPESRTVLSGDMGSENHAWDQHKVETKDKEKEGSLNGEKQGKEIVEPQQTDSGELGKTKVKGNSGGSFLVILFYYFQDASLMKIQTVYVESPKYIENIETIVSEIFRFRFNFFSIVASELCIFPGMDIIQREFLLAIFAPLLIFTSGLMYMTFKGFYKVTDKQCLYGLAIRAVSALILGLLFSYQKLAVTSMSFLYCVPVLEDKVLFIDGTVSCYRLWQYLTLAYVIICIFPFSVHLAVAPAFLERGWISFPEFVIASLVPLPFIISWIFRFRSHNKKTARSISSEVDTITAILQGPYRNFQLPGVLKSFCWSGMIMARRLVLMIAKTFITNILFSLTVAFITCVFAILQQVAVRPYKDSLSNLAALLSGVALVVVSCVNLIRAAFESAEYVPIGPVMHFVKALDIVESLVLVWIPLVGLAILAVAFCVRVFTKLIIRPIVTSCCNKSAHIQ